MQKDFLPISKADMEKRGWEQLDFVLVTADAYIDHHSFGTAIISRVLEHAGYKVGIIPQPNWKDTTDFMKLGRPRLAFLVNGGNMDPMVNHYTVSKRLRERDMYSPGGKMGLRPDRATIVYCNKIREAYKDVDIVIGGIEASLRRFAHYDYWTDKVRKSILIDSGADLLLYGMSERQIVQVANALNDGLRAQYIRYLEGTSYVASSLEEVFEYRLMPSYKEVCEDKLAYARAYKMQEEEQDHVRGQTLVQEHNGKYVVQNKPEGPLTREELDEVYGLPYMKNYHPIYEKAGGIPAIEEVKFSLVSSRGCFGNCSFCAIALHQGRVVTSRSQESIVKEAEEMTCLPDFKGYIHDVGGPTANFRGPACSKQIKKGACKEKQCLTPSPCKAMHIDHHEYLELLRKVRSLPGVKKAFVRSGIRYDYVMADKENDAFFKELVEHHVSGQLKVAPEHVSKNVLAYMGKPSGKIFDDFCNKFYKINEKLGKKQYIIPYLMSSHPGSTLKDAVQLAEYLRDIHYQPEQVQDFYPTPGTLSTTMFYTGVDPRTMKPVYVPKTKSEKAMQRALLQYRNPKKYEIVYDALIQAGREDLIGYGPKCLIKPKEERKGRQKKSVQAKKDSPKIMNRTNHTMNTKASKQKVNAKKQAKRWK
ncbi:YgiQ family radical SAM protein [Sporanaerobium hydrogeniformans]|uniref:YgiQ family radical SAM protein n=1 Tax=Sporanaerobium hydrogeniformans TaxID=3072179 RepID=A0AC61DFL2_9FIRM|nr:YgiQ family radical SAM protein [Sporanaerobium hydrogeniformans]PHV72009.1 YgiQ family radical SAM protein [Sporanaerobium hydrogeniformans]